MIHTFLSEFQTTNLLTSQNSATSRLLSPYHIFLITIRGTTLQVQKLINLAKRIILCNVSPYISPICYRTSINTGQNSNYCLHCLLRERIFISDEQYKNIILPPPDICTTDVPDEELDNFILSNSPFKSERYELMYLLKIIDVVCGHASQPIIISTQHRTARHKCILSSLRCTHLKLRKCQ